jgi:hypothetical protein
MNTYRPLTPKEAQDLMHQFGYSMNWRSGDHETMVFSKDVGDHVTLHCRLSKDVNKPGHWLFSFSNIPGVQMMVEVRSTGDSSFPHPKFHRFERNIVKFALACAQVADEVTI